MQLLLSNIGLTFLLGVLQILSLTASAVTTNPPMTMLTGVGFQNEATQTGISYLSMAGGARIQVLGSMLGDMPNSNSVLFYPSATPGVSIPGTPLSQDDEFSSNSMMGILSYTTPSVMTLLGRTWDQLNGQSGPLGWNPTVDFTIDIINNDDGGGELACVTKANCLIKYSRDYTPVLMYTTPNEVYYGQLLQFHINVKYASNAQATPLGMPPIGDIRLAGYLTDISPIDADSRPKQFNRDHVEVFVGNNPPAENSDPKILFRNGYAQNLSTLQNCNFAGDKCWTVKTHPVINSVTANSGNTVGGQELTIKGFGFNGTDATVTVDGVACAIKSRTAVAITCVTGAASAESFTNQMSPGQPGLTQSLYLKPDGTDLGWADFVAANLVNSTLQTSFETYDSLANQEHRGQTLSGWFTAPTTGKYRFYTSCDDWCQLLLDTVNPYNAASFVTPAPTVIAYRYGAINWRNYWFNETASQISAWINLQAGQSYYIKGQMIEFTGDDHFTVSVEIEQPNAASHPKAMKQIQKLQVTNVANVFESWTYVVSVIDGGTFKFNFLNPTTTPQSYWQSPEVAANASPSTIQNVISQYTNAYFGGSVTVVRQQYDKTAAETTIAANVTSYRYTITMNKLINGVTANAVSITKVSTKSTFTVTPPMLAIKSTAPIAGSYIITCVDSQGTSWSTNEIAFNTGEQWIQNAITQKIPFLADQIEVAPDYQFNYKDNGVSFNLRFSGLNAQTPLCTIKSGVIALLTGNSPSFSGRAITTYGQSLFFEPIPLEFLTTPVQQPQIKVSVVGNQALCKNLNCDYVYSAPVETIDSQTLTGNSLSMTGTSIPAVLAVTVGGALCENVVSTSTSITCTFSNGPAAGTWTPQVRTAKGSIPNTGAAVVVPLVATSVTPNLNINYLGGDTLTIVGSGFGFNPSQASVVFADLTICKVSTLTSTQLLCVVQSFTQISSAPVSLTITVNGAVDSTLSVTQVAAVQQSFSISPNSVSPVLKTTLTITLDPSYPTILKVADLKVTLLSDADSTFTKDLFIMSVDDATKAIKVKFGGAVSGNYHISVWSKQYGKITMTNLALVVGSSVTNITPLIGSMYGGTLVTITGINFSTDPLDNPVKVGSNYCNVLTSSTTQITCRIVDIVAPAALPQQTVLVFLKTSEEAKCSGTCLFDYVTPSATTTGITSAFDVASQTTQVTISGSGLTGPAELYLDGVKQTYVSLADTSAIFTLTSFGTQTPLSVKFYSDQGTPNSASAIANPSLKITPTLISLTPTIGSAAGTVIKVTGSGFGSLTTTLNLWSGASGNVCSKVTYVDSLTLLCTTNPVFMNAGELKLNTGNAQTSALDTSSTQFSQTTDVAYSSAVISGNTISFSGTNLPTSATVLGTYNGVTATSGTSDGTTAVLTFTKGIPVSTAAIAPTLYFKNADNTLIFANPVSQITFDNPLTVGSSSNNLSCSFAGGCAYTVTGNGLFSTLQQSGNSIDVCGSKCSLSTTLSDASKAVCLLPTISTNYSVQNFKTVVPSVVTGTFFPADPKLTDSNLMVDHVDTSTTTCNFGMKFAINHQVVLDEQKVFINKLFDKTPFVNNLVFQGSNDGITFTDITTFGNEIHEGWNYVSYRDLPSKPSYNVYRYWGKVAGSCRVGEFRLTGVDVIADTNPTYPCTPNLIISGVTTPLTPVTFDGSMTPTLQSISPRFGTVTGGTTVTFTGTNFDTVTPGTSVLIDNRVCAVSTVTSTTITCVTDKKPYVPDTPALIINQPGFGNVATAGLIFRYVSLYSDPITWGGDAPPQAGESISVPKGQHLLVDIDNSPKLNAVIVEGSLIFAPDDTNPNHQKTFDAHYIMVNGGYMEVGTEQFPYTSKLTITMHGNKFSPFLPTYGNKVIGVRFGILEMHGVPRPITWTRMSQTANVGDTSIQLTEVTDWKVGEQIVIATTSFSNEESETRIIKTITGGNLITFDAPLAFKHISEKPQFGGVDMPMQCEVGLLSRNVIYRGDPETSAANQYGAHIMIHSPGDESAIGRIEYIELTDVGQAFKLGRYPLHFHMIGTVNQSYVRGNAIHQTYNRAVTLHGIHYFRVINNVAFDTMGHTIFVEDAVETRNYIHHNLIVQVKSSFSLLNTDWTPGGMWITHPNNIFVENVVAGSDAYGFWFDMQDTSVGPSYSPNICPVGETLGEFRDNTAHSTHKYGLRIHHVLLPRENPCKPMPAFNKTNTADPYLGNRPILADFINFVGWKAGRNCAISERTGYIHYTNFKCADSGIAGIEFSMTNEIADGYAKISGGMVIGNTGVNNDDGQLGTTRVWGVITPRTEGMTVENVSFYNFNFAGSAAIGDCSHCFHPAATDSGARTVRTSGLVFDAATVPQKIFYQLPWRGIFLDLDGSLTGLGPNSWATPNWAHNRVTECTVSLPVHNGLICTSAVQVRRVAIYQASPSALKAMELKISTWDDSQVATLKADNTTYNNYLLDQTMVNFSKVPMKDKLDPMASWCMPYVTGHTYRMHWAQGIDFTAQTIELSNQWLPTDKDIVFVMNHTDVRQAINVTTISKKQIMNNTYPTDKLAGNLTMGDNILNNDTATREFRISINAKDITGDRNKLNLLGIACVANCVPTVAVIPISDTIKYWSNITSWPLGKLPVEGDEVEIQAGLNLVLDLVETPILKKLWINGRLSFQNDPNDGKNINLRARLILVQAGELIIGNATNPFNATYTAQVTLYGKTNDVTLLLGGSVEAGNKVLATNGKVSMFGAPRSRWSRLTQSAFKNATSIFVEPYLDWRAGDKIYIAQNTLQWTQADYKTVVSYNIGTGEIVLTSPMLYYHYGDYDTTASRYDGVDIRAEVILLSRNVRVVGTDEDAWGATILAADAIQDNGVALSAQIIFDQVEMFNCSQRDNDRAALRFEGTFAKQHTVTNSVVHEGQGWGVGVLVSSNVNIQKTSFIGFTQQGVHVEASSNINFDGVFAGDITKRKLSLMDNVVDKESCFSVCTWFENNPKCTNVNVINSIVAGCPYAGFVVRGHDCGLSATQQSFRNNVAHSIDGTGAHIVPDSNVPGHTTCYEGSYFSAYKTQQPPISTMYKVAEIRHTHMVFIDTQLGAVLQTGIELPYLKVMMDSIHIYGESEADDCPPKHKCYCKDKSGIMLSGGNTKYKFFHIDAASALPSYKIKSYGAYNISTEFINMTFENFSNQTRCGARQRIFEINEHSSDNIPVQVYKKARFVNVTNDAVAFLMDPDPAWANKDDCGPFPCTAPSNVVIQFTGTTFDGVNTPKLIAQDFQIISDTEGVSNTFTSCKNETAWNAFACTNPNLGVLYFESLDADTEDRSVQPIYVTNEATGAKNVLNSMMDHMWDGFYTGQVHLSRFPSIIEVKGNYTVEMTGTPPGKMRYTIIGGTSKAGVKVKVPYWNAGSYEITVNGNIIPYTPWDTNIGRNAELTLKKGCGENRFVGVQNFLEFYITPGCVVYVAPRNAIMGGVRLEWTMSEFYASGGVVSFTDRVAFVLGIHASQIKTVAVYQGSVVIEYLIMADKDDSRESQTLKKLNTQMTALIQSDNASQVFGAPVLSATGQGKPITITPRVNSSVKGGKANTAGVKTSAATNGANGNNAIFNNQVLPEIEQVTIVITRPKASVNTAAVTVADAKVIETEESLTNTKMYVIIGVVGGILLVVGAGVLTFFLVKKKSQEQIVEKIDVRTVVKASGNGFASETEMEAQYHPQAVDDINIFAPANSIKKMNQDEIHSESREFSSNFKLHNNVVEVDHADTKGTDFKLSSKKPAFDFDA